MHVTEVLKKPRVVCKSKRTTIFWCFAFLIVTWILSLKYEYKTIKTMVKSFAPKDVDVQSVHRSTETISDEVKTSNNASEHEEAPSNITVKMKTMDFSITDAKVALHPTDITTSKGYCDLSWSYPTINASQYDNNRPIKNNQKSNIEYKARPVFDNPKLLLDSEKFLYPAVRWGPNNQLYGFLEGVLLSIVLNRTLVLPKFFKHESDRQNRGAPLSPSHRVDVETLCKFIPCITLEEFRQTCNYQIHGVLRTKKLDFKDIKNFEKFTGLKVPLQSTTNITTALSKIQIPIEGNEIESFVIEEAKEWFNTSARCLLYPYPMFDFKIYNDDGNRIKLHDHTGTNRVVAFPPKTDGELYISVMQHYKRPAYIRKIADTLIEEMTNGNPFLSIHWRYNKNDFLSEYHCKNKDYNQNLCDRATSFTTEEFAAKIEDKIAILEKNNHTVKHIYIATPPNELEAINKVGELLLNKRGWETHTSVQFTDIFKKKYRDCDVIWKNYDDIVSTLEMEICSRGLAFIGSRGTTWTGAVRATRIFGNISGIDMKFDGKVI